MDILFRLVRIEVPQFAIVNDKKINAPLNIDTEAKFTINDLHTILKNSLKIVFKTDQDLIMQIVVDSYYEIKKECWNEMTKDDGTIEIPADLLQHLVSISVGTTRGIIYEKTRNTGLENFLMPLINTQSFVKGNMVIKNSK